MRSILFLFFLPGIFLGCNPKTSQQQLSSNTGNAESVFLTSDHNDNPVVAWTERQAETLTLFFSIGDANAHFNSEPIQLPLPADVATHAEGMPKVAFKSDGTIIAAYEKKSPTKENKYAGSIYYVMSNDGGKTWSPESFLHSDTVAGRSRSYFDIQRLPDGEIGAAWLDIKLEKTTGGRSVRFARTIKSGAFSNEILVDSSACQCCRIDVYSDENKDIFIAYRGLQRGPMGKQVRDMMIATSTDHGNSFSNPLLISADDWFIDGCPHTGPSLCGNKAGLISLWYTEGTGTGIYYAKKERGDSFSPRQLVSHNGRHPQLSANRDQIAMVWEENMTVNDQTNTTIHFQVLENGNAIIAGPLTPDKVNSFLPVIAKSGEGFVTAYLGEEKGKVGVYITHLD